MRNKENDNPELRGIPKFSFWDSLRRYYEPDAQAIIEQIADGNNVIVTNGHGVGKTQLLSRAIRELAKPRGYEVSNADYYIDIFRGRGDLDSLLERKFRSGSVESKKLFIVDEFQCGVLQEPDLSRRFLSDMTANQVQLLFYIPLPTEEERLAVARTTQELEEGMGVPCVIYRMKQTTIPPDLARRELIQRGAEADLIDFYLNPENSALLSPGLYGYFPRIKTIKELRDGLTISHYGSWTTVWAEWLGKGRLGGGSKAEMVRMLINIGILSEDTDKAILSVDVDENTGKETIHRIKEIPEWKA